MPFADDPVGPLAVTAGRVQVGASAVAEIAWFLIFAMGDKRMPEGSPLRELVASSGGLASAARRCFADSVDYFAELYVLAAFSGTLLGDDLEPMLERVQEVAASAAAAPDVGLHVEPPTLRASVLERIGRIATEAPFRRRYRDVLRTAWEAYRPLWEDQGRDAVAHAAADLERRIRETGSTVEPLPPDSIVRGARFAAVIRDAERSGQIVISPVFAAWGRAGGHLFDLPGTVVFGVPILARSLSQERRQNAEAVAASMKVLADGTRVALLSSLASRPASVTDLAEEFELAQPTVSAHVGKLRSAGLLESRRENGRTVYSTSSERVDRLLDDARALLLRCCDG